MSPSRPRAWSDWTVAFRLFESDRRFIRQTYADVERELAAFEEKEAARRTQPAP